MDRDFDFWTRYRKPNTEKAVELYYEISEKYGLDMSQMSLKFCEIQDFMTSVIIGACLLYTSPSPRDGLLSRMPSSA